MPSMGAKCHYFHQLSLFRGGGGGVILLTVKSNIVCQTLWVGTSCSAWSKPGGMDCKHRDQKTRLFNKDQVSRESCPWCSSSNLHSQLSSINDKGSQSACDLLYDVIPPLDCVTGFLFWIMVKHTYSISSGAVLYTQISAACSWISMVTHITYKNALISKGLRCPLWEPNPGEYAPVELADVGYLCNRGFVTFFNVLKARDDLSNQHRLPDGHIPLQVGGIQRKELLPKRSEHILSEGISKIGADLSFMAGWVFSYMDGDMLAVGWTCNMNDCVSTGWLFLQQPMRNNEI